MMRLSISRKVTLAMVFYTLLLLFGVGVTLYLLGEKTQRESIYRELTASAIEKEAALISWIVDTQNDLNAFVAIHHYSEILSGYFDQNQAVYFSDPNLRDLVEVDLNNFLRSNPNLSGIEILHPESGEILFSTRPEDRGKFRETRLYFLEGRRGAAAPPPYLPVGEVKPIFTISTPIVARDGRLLGVMAAHLNMDVAEQIINRRTGLRTTDEAYLVDRAHVLITRPRFAQSNTVFRGIYSDAVNRCLEGKSGSISARDYRDVPAEIVYRWIDEYQICLVEKMDSAEAFGELTNLVRSLLMVITSAFLIGLAVSAWLGNTITRPIKELSLAVEQIRSGNLAYRIRKIGRDEIGALAAAINQMVDSLQQSEIETRYHQQLLVALSQAAAALQQARSLPEIYRALDEQVSLLGFQVVILSIEHDIGLLRISYLGIEDELRRGLEQLTGLSLNEIRLPIRPGGVVDRIIYSRDAEYITETTEFLREIIPHGLEDQADEIIRMLDMQSGIASCIVKDQVVSGLLLITGGRLSQQDAPAIKAFANQTAIAVDNVELFDQLVERAQALQEEHNFVEAVLQTSGALVVVTDARGKVVRANQAYCDTTGFTEAALVGKYIWNSVLDPAERPVLQRIYQELQSSGRPINYENEIQAKDGQKRLIAWTNTYLPGSEINPGYIISSGIDITERKQAELALREAKDTLEKRVEERTQELQQSWHTLRVMLDSIPDIAVLFDRAGNILAANQAFGQLAGCDVDTMIGRNLREFMPAELEQQSRAYLLNIFRTGKTELAEMEHAGHIYDVGFYPILENQRAVKAVVMAVDKTVRKRAETALRESEIRFRTLFETAPVGVAIIRHRKITLANRAFTRMFGQTADQPVDEILVDDLLPKVKQDQVYEQYDRLVRGELEVLELDTTGQRLDGSTFPLHLAVGRMDLADGPVTIVFCVDITQQKQAEEALARRTQDLVRSNEELERFAYVASHDLQEPLRMVSSYLQLIERRYTQVLDQDGKEFIRFAVDGAARMKGLINDLLAYSRVGTRGKAFAPVDLNQTLADVLQNLQMAVEEAGAQIESAPLPVVMADDRQMEQLFQNLIANAIKFRRPGVAPQIVIACEEKDQEYLFTVKDNGIGIEPAYLKKIFVLFQRLHTQQEYPGSGIGLAISQRIVERHGGRIWVESVPGEGSSLFFTIPRSGENA